MAEGWARALRNEALEPYSAGVAPSEVNQHAVQVMLEGGVDINGHSSKHVDTLHHISFDYVVTVCGDAQESCPVFSSVTKVLHVGFDDPPRLARSARTSEEALEHYRRVRDEIRAFIETLPHALYGTTPFDIRVPFKNPSLGETV